jgi:exopolysaccharide biosynthesis polyprenyl glycosylphosphotransferase
MEAEIAGTAIQETANSTHREKKLVVIPYKPILALHDVLVAACAGILGAWLSAGVLLPGAGLKQRALLLGLCMMPIAYFGMFRLYSYHLIYSPRYHLRNMCKTFVLSLLTLGIVRASYSSQVTLPEGWLLPGVAVLVIGALLISRFYGDQPIILLKPVGLACIVIGLAGLMGQREEPFIPNYWREILAGASLSMILLLATRSAIVHLVFSRALRRRFRRQALLIGTNSDAENITDLIIRLKAPLWIAGTVSTCADCRLNTVVRKDSLGKIKDLEAIAGENFFQEVIITDESIEKPELIGLLDLFTSRGITIWFLPKLMPIIDLKLEIDELCGMPMIRLGSNQYQWVFRRMKYAFDAVAALVGFILFLPVFAAFALFIKLTSEGPVFYRPTAVGKGGSFFKMYKFRSMIPGASSTPHKEYVTKLIKGEIIQDGSRKTLKITNDPRVTWIGRALRRTSMDELPQIINVLKGEMSLVGPRPCLPYEYEAYKDWHKKRTAVRPGITGLWQVVGRSEVSFEDMILLDLYYIFNRSLELDLNILFETVFAVLKKKGAY